MKITNQFNLPKPFENIARNPTYSKGKAHISATSLLNSPKIITLLKKHDADLTQDVADMLPSIFGSAMHYIVEKGADENNLVEERFHAELDGWHVSGAVDLQVVDSDGIHIKDYKTTSVWAVMNDKPEWEQQLNIYAWLIAVNKKVTIKSLQIVAFLKDWSKKEAERKPDYPQKGIAMVDIPLWTFEEQEAFIKGRIAKHSAAEFAMETNAELPDCTPQEMWEKPPVWAVIKQGNVRAKSLHDSPELAEIAKKELGSEYEIQIRQGERTRCKDYCLVNKWCNQYKTYLEKQG
jgi:PD-(D/E)XK nuclease superfamily